MKAMGAIYNSLLWSLLVAILCFSNTWLQMRVNTGYLFFACWLLLAVILLARSRQHAIHQLGTIISTAACLVIAFLVEGWSNLLVVPASLIREGLHMPTLPFAAVNTVLAVILVGGLLISAISLLRKG